MYKIKNDNLNKEAKFLNQLIRAKLKKTFKKNENDIDLYLKKTNVIEQIRKNPKGLDDSVLNWCLFILSDNNDNETLTKYYKKIYKWFFYFL